MNVDGSALTRLTNTDAFDFSPVWSPDGTRIAYTVIGGGIHVMNADGSGQALMTIDQNAVNPAWSPDGKKIAYDNGGAVYVQELQSGIVTLLTSNGTEPSWSPNGTQLAFASRRDGGAEQSISEIYTMNSDGSEQTRLTFLQCCEPPFPHSNHTPLWSR